MVRAKAEHHRYFNRSAACRYGRESLRATASGPTVGAYATYFNAGFSTDLTVKFDFLTLDETFNDLFATTGAYTFAATGFGVPPFISFAGAGSVNLLN